MLLHSFKYNASPFDCNLFPHWFFFILSTWRVRMRRPRAPPTSTAPWRPPQTPATTDPLGLLRLGLCHHSAAHCVTTATQSGRATRAGVNNYRTHCGCLACATFPFPPAAVFIFIFLLSELSPEGKLFFSSSATKPAMCCCCVTAACVSPWPEPGNECHLHMLVETAAISADCHVCSGLLSRVRNQLGVNKRKRERLHMSPGLSANDVQLLSLFLFFFFFPSPLTFSFLVLP